MIKTVVIVGGGFAGWYTAAAFKHNLPDVSVTVIDSERHPRLGVGETLGWSAPYDWQRLLGLKDDRMLMWRTGAIYKRGTTATNFWHDNTSFSYGKFFNLKISALAKFYGNFDYPEFDEPWNHKQGDVGLQQAWLTINQNNNDKNFNDYIAELDEAGHFTANPLAPYDQNNQYILRPTDGYSYHIDAEQTVGFFKDLALEGTAKHISSAVVGAVTNEQNRVQHLVLENNQTVSADLFIDASGFARALLKHVPNNTWVDIDNQSNSAWVAPNRYKDPHKEMCGGTQFFGEDHGWRFKINLYHRGGNGYIFNSKHTDPELPLQRINQVTDGVQLQDPKLLQWTPGYYRNPWQENLLPLGISSGLIDPFDAPSFDIHSRGLEDLFKALKQPSMDQAQEHFNQNYQLVTEERYMRLLFNFGLSKRTGPFWDRRRALIADRMHDIKNIINSKRDDLQGRLPHFWQQMYLRMVMVTGTDRTLFDAVPLTDQDRAMAQSFFDYNRARGQYIAQQQWPNNYEWLKENRFNGKTSDEMLQQLCPHLNL